MSCSSANARIVAVTINPVFLSVSRETENGYATVTIALVACGRNVLSPVESAGAISTLQRVVLASPRAGLLTITPNVFELTHTTVPNLDPCPTEAHASPGPEAHAHRTPPTLSTIERRAKADVAPQ